MQQTHVRICSDDLFTIELQNQAQHTVSGGMLRAEIDCVVPDLALVGICWVSFQCAVLHGTTKAGIYGYEACCSIFHGLSEPSGRSGGETAELLWAEGRGGGAWAEAESLGAVAGEAGE